MRQGQLSVALMIAATALACGCGTTATSDGGSERDAETDFDAGTDFDGGTGLDAATDDAPMDAGAFSGVAHWELPRSGPNELLLPWPSNMALNASGTVQLDYLPNAGANTFVQGYVTTMAGRLDGFSTVGAAYFRFSVPLDTTTFPANVADTMVATSTIQIIDVDPASPQQGQRHPAQVFYRELDSDYWTPRTLAVAPAFGFPLREHTRYAIVVTTGVRDSGGEMLARDRDLAAVLDATAPADAAVEAARALHEPAVAILEGAGIARDEILSLALYDTANVTDELFRVIDQVSTTSSAPAVIDIVRRSNAAGFDTYAGHFGPNPIYQEGVSPYTEPGSGGFVFDAGGMPVVDHTENFTFRLSVPDSTSPAAGWPVVIFAHGTGGNADSAIDDVAASLAAQGLAVFSFDQIFNGDRAAAGDAEVNLINLGNPAAGRTNNRQAAIDLLQTTRLLASLRVSSSVSYTGRDIVLDPDRVTFFGHSQGAVAASLLLAADTGAGASVLSGASGTMMLSLLRKIANVNTAVLLATALGITDSSELVPLHPMMTLVQTALDAADPVNYGIYVLREPRPGLTPRHIYQTQGFVDEFAPSDGIATLAMALGLQLAEPVLEPVALYPLTGLDAGSLPLSLNVAGNQATGVWQQFLAVPESAGHFVVFDNAEARARAARFLASYDPSFGAVTVSP